MVTKAHEDGNRPQAASVPAADLYAGGADATAIRCMVRKTAMMEGCGYQRGILVSSKEAGAGVSDDDYPTQTIGPSGDLPT